MKKQSLFGEDERRPLTVSELNSDVKRTLERGFRGVWVEGEITNFHNAASGHWYFTLGDGESQLKAACYRGTNFRIRFEPFDGLQVRVRGSITVYAPRGEFQILVDSLEPVGEGALTVAFEQIKAKLAAEGLFDESTKRPLPSFPRKVGVVTSPTGAAIHDIINVLSRRARSVSVMLMPTMVQGEFAAASIAEAIANANDYNASVEQKDRIDVLIVGRGGGSAEDLWAFNEEIVARSIRASEIPVISAVGHEVDFTIADMVSDVRAATPSAAAEIVAQSEAEIRGRIEERARQITKSLNYRLLRARSAFKTLALSPIFERFPARIRDYHGRVDRAESRLNAARTSVMHSASQRLDRIAAKLSPAGLSQKAAKNEHRLSALETRMSAAGNNTLNAAAKALGLQTTKLDTLSPLAVLGRGYSITQKASDGSILTKAIDTAAGERLKIRLADGNIDAEVIDTGTNIQCS